MKHYYLLFAVFLGLAVAVSSCGEKFDCEDLEQNVGDTCDDNDDRTEDDMVTEDCTCEGTKIPITYSNTVAGILNTSCAVSGCHTDADLAGGFSLASYAQASGAAGFGRMLGAINQEEGFTAMPPNGTKLDQQDIDDITEWIENGTPE